MGHGIFLGLYTRAGREIEFSSPALLFLHVFSWFTLVFLKLKVLPHQLHLKLFLAVSCMFVVYLQSYHRLVSFVTYLASKLHSLTRKVAREVRSGLFVSSIFLLLRQINYSLLYQRFPILSLRGNIVSFFPVYPCLVKYRPPVFAGLPFPALALWVIL